MRFRLFIALLAAVFCFSCSKKSKSFLIQNEESLVLYGHTDESIKSIKSRCLDPLEHIPYPELKNQFPFRIIRMNFHFMHRSDKKLNFEGETARIYARSLMEDANLKLSRNKKMNLPEGNETPVIDPNYRYEMAKDDEKGLKGDAVYFHTDDELYHFINKGRKRNNYSREVIKKYGLNTDSILNVFVMPHHPDSVASKTYTGSGSGIALGSSLKMAGMYASGSQAWAFSTMFNHEVGHILGLRHTSRGNDGCDDTPNHPNCWYSSGEPPCDGITSNNMMDANNSQMAITPCQIGIMQKNMSRDGAMQRKLVRPDWCHFDSTKTVYISDTTYWHGARDISGDIVIENGGYLEVNCRVAMAKGSKIIVEPKGVLVLNNSRFHNDCGYDWDGIQIQQKGDQIGKVQYFGEVDLEHCSKPSQP